MTYNNDTATSLDSWFPAFPPITDPEALQHGSVPHHTNSGHTEESLPDDGSHWYASPAESMTAAAARAPRAARRRRVSARALGVVAAVGAVAACVGAAVVYTSVPNNSQPIAAAPPTSPTLAPDTAAIAAPESAPWCPESTTDGVVTGAGPGGTNSGSAAILAFENAYYVERSGAAAREILSANASLASATADELQRGIDTIPAGTEHCVSIRATVPDTYAVTLEQRYSDGTRTTDKQTIVTTDAGGRTFITSIGAAQ